MPRKTRKVQWDEIHDAVEKIARRLAFESARGDIAAIRRVIGVARGGCVPAVMVAHALGVTAFESVQVQAYADQRRLDMLGLPDHLPSASFMGSEDSTLVVDDIIDTGRTRSFLRYHYPKAVYVSLVARDPSMGAPIVEPFAWVHFPWET